MKAKFLHGAALWTFLLAATLAAGCSDDDNDYKDVDGQNPTLELTSDHVRTLAGYEFKITGKVADKDGICSIRLLSSELFLDKTIDLVALYPETLYEYDLNYGFTIPDGTESESFTVKVAVTDLGGRTVESSVLITMDGDYTEPEITYTDFSDNIKLVLSEDNPKTFRFTAKDDKGLAYLELLIPELNISERMDCAGEGELEATFNKAVTFPSDEVGAYIMTIRAVDAFDNIIEKECTILISETRDYDNMYLVDFAEMNNHLLTDNDIWGVPMPIEHIGEYTYKARYYSAVENTPVRFITNKENFDICFGKVAGGSEGKLTALKEEMEPISLPGKGYYEITFNIKNGTYSVSSYTPEEAAYSGEAPLSIIGGGFVNNPGWWDTSNPYILTKDNENPYIYTGTLSFDSNITDRNFLDCTIAPRGGWGPPSWRFDGKNERFVPGEEVENSRKENIPTGEYTFVFDTHLVQSKLIKKNN